MSETYHPANFTISNSILTLVSEISHISGVLTASEYLSKNPILRKSNRIQSIHSSLAIENNSFELPQVSDIIDGKPVIGPLDEICEVKNAYSAYSKLETFDPYSMQDLLTAHKIMLDGLVREAGTFRTGFVGVFKGNELIHEGVHPEYIAEKVSALMEWCKSTDTHPLITSCIFHYQFEFIHPFSDGNGRTGRLWQTVILSKWQSLFAWLPIESLILKNQQEYYDAINSSNEKGDCTVFIEFMLKTILDSLNAVTYTSKNLAEQIYQIICFEPGINGIDLSKKVGRSTKTIQRYIKQLKEEEKIEYRGALKNGGYYTRE